MQLRWKEAQRCDFGLTEEVLFVGFERRTRTTRAWRLETGAWPSFDSEVSRCPSAASGRSGRREAAGGLWKCI